MYAASTHLHVCIYMLKQLLLLFSSDLSREEIPSEMGELERQFGKLKDEVYESVKVQPVDTFKIRLTSLTVNGVQYHMDYLKEIVNKLKDVWPLLSLFIPLSWLDCMMTLVTLN